MNDKRQQALAAILDRHPEAFAAFRELLNVMRQYSGGMLPWMTKQLEKAIQEASTKGADR